MTDTGDVSLTVRLLSITRNQDLSEWTFLSSDQKSLCKNLVESGLTTLEFAKRHCLSYSTMKRYIRKYNKWRLTGVDDFHDSRGGRPSLVDDTGIINIRHILRAAVANQACQKTMVSNFQLMLENEARETKKRRGLADLEGRVSKKFVKRFKNDNNFVDATCQFKTHARIFAESDPRNLYSFAVMNDSFMSSRDASMCFNWDATQYCVDAEGHATIVKCKGDDERPPTALSAGGLGFAIKYYHFHNAAGDMAPMVLIVADDTMGDNEFFFSEIPGLSHTQLLDAVGYLVFTKTRNCNSSFYQWYANFVVAPFVLKCRASYCNTNPDGTPMRAFVVCDGEPSQIQVFQEATILKLMSDSLIDFGKSPASCSAITQASDDSDFFKASKRKLVRIRESDYIHPGLDKRLKDILLGRLNVDGEHRLTSARRTLICNSLQQVVYSIQHVLTPEIVKAGYRRIGQFPVSFSMTMSRCTRVISWKDMEHMREKLSAMVAIFRSTGVLTESQMDEAGIVSVNDEASNGRPKDDRPLHQQRSVIMNGDDCIAQYRSYINNRDAEPARRALAAEAREAARLVREQKAEGVRERRDLKDTEKARRLLLTPAELKDENRMRRQANKIAKLAARHAEIIPQGAIDDALSDDERDNLFAEHEIDDISSNVRLASV